MWVAATPTQAHPYLTDKIVQSHGLRQDEVGRLLVPVQDADGRIWSIQKIGSDGFKSFQEGGKVEGGHFVIGDLLHPGPILIAEGYATAATLHEMTGMPSDCRVQCRQSSLRGSDLSWPLPGSRHLRRWG